MIQSISLDAASGLFYNILLEMFYFSIPRLSIRNKFDCKDWIPSDLMESTKFKNDSQGELRGILMNSISLLSRNLETNCKFILYKLDHAANQTTQWSVIKSHINPQHKCGINSIPYNAQTTSEAEEISTNKHSLSSTDILLQLVQT